MKSFFFVVFAGISIATSDLCQSTSAFGQSTPAYRIVSLNPSLTRVLIDLGLQKSVVGAVSIPGTPFPKELSQNVKDVGSYVKPMIEKIIELKPTHVLMIREGEDKVSAQLEKAKTKTVILDGRYIQDFAPLLTRIGEEFQEASQVRDLLVQWETDWRAVSAQTQGQKKSRGLRAVLMLQVDPVYIAGEDTFLSQVLEKCGLKNAFRGKGYPRLGREQLELMELDRIIYFSMLGQAKEETAVQEFWKKSVKHRAKPLMIETNPQMAQLSLELPKLTQKFCQKVIQE